LWLGWRKKCRHRAHRNSEKTLGGSEEKTRLARAARKAHSGRKFHAGVRRGPKLEQQNLKRVKKVRGVGFFLLGGRSSKKNSSDR